MGWILSMLLLHCLKQGAWCQQEQTCSSSVTCEFNNNDPCGFSADQSWKIHGTSPGSNGPYVLMQNTRLATATMASPPLCNGDVTVTFTAVIVTYYSPVTDLHVLTQCDSVDLPETQHVVHGSTVPASRKWMRYNFTLPACPQDQTQKVVFRAVKIRDVRVKVALDDVRITQAAKHVTLTIESTTSTTKLVTSATKLVTSTTKHVTNATKPVTTEGVHSGGCVNRVCCGFEETTCGFTQSENWKLERSTSGWYERYENRGRATATELSSPDICNGRVTVTFSLLIIALVDKSPTLQVQTQCDAIDLEGQTGQGHEGGMTEWGNFTITLPSCPEGKIQRVMFRASHAYSDGSVIMLDNIFIYTNSSASQAKMSCDPAGNSGALTSPTSTTMTP